MLQLNNALDKLESDLITNKCPERCEDFMIIDHTESLIPGRFWHKFVEKKDQLLMEQSASFFKAISTFLKTKTSLIQKYIGDETVEYISKESSNSKDPRIAFVSIVLLPTMRLELSQFLQQQRT